MNKIFISDLDDDRLSIYKDYTENELRHYFEPNGGIFICETPMVIKRALEKGCEPISFLVEDKAINNNEVIDILNSCKPDIEVFIAELEVLNKLTGYNLTRGVLAAIKRPSDTKIEELLMHSNKIVVLDEVVNPTNVGAIFRSAAALGAQGIILTSGCSDPYYRRAARVSMGTVFQIPWVYLKKEESVSEILHMYGFKMVSMALREDAISLLDDRIKQEEKIAVLLGTESTGIREELIDASDYKVIIPMSNGVDSLNVAAASAVAFWELFK